MLLRRLALVLWLVSLILPTLPTPDIGNLPGTPLRGAYLLAKSVVMALYLPHSIGYPLHLLSLASNVVFFRELLTLVPRWRHSSFRRRYLSSGRRMVRPVMHRSPG